MIELSKHKQGRKVIVQRKNGDIIATGKLFVVGRELWVIRLNNIANVFSKSFIESFYYYDKSYYEKYLPF